MLNNVLMLLNIVSWDIYSIKIYVSNRSCTPMNNQVLLLLADSFLPIGLNIYRRTIMYMLNLST